MAGAGVVGVAVGDQRPVDGAPGVDVEIAGGAVDAFRREGQHGHAPKIAGRGGASNGVRRRWPGGGKRV